MNEIWYDEIDENVVSYISYVLKARLKGRFPKLFVTDEEEDYDYAKFPAVLITSLEPREIGQDLTNESVNAVVCAYNIVVTDNQSRENVKTVAREVVALLKELRFNITLLPKYQSKDGIKYGFIRCTRTVGKDDKEFLGS